MAGRSFTMVAWAIWRSERFLAVSSEAKALHFYFLTNEHQTSAGAYRLPDGYACADLRWTVERYQTARAELVDAGLIAFDAETSEIYVSRWFKHCGPKGQKQEAGARRTIEDIESDHIREQAEAEFLEAQGPPANVHALDNPFPDRLTSTAFMSGRR